jgi:hypothetical protein
LLVFSPGLYVLVNEEALQDVIGICLEKIRVAAENGTLKNHPKLLYILYRSTVHEGGQHGALK